jgi:hypothetical protein
MLSLDIGSAIVQAINMLINQHRIDKYCRLVFSMAFSGIVTFLFVAGSTMGSLGESVHGVGAGMAAAAVAMTVVYRRSELAKGTTVALPQAEADLELNSNLQVITK